MNTKCSFLLSSQQHLKEIRNSGRGSFKLILLKSSWGQKEREEKKVFQPSKFNFGIKYEDASSTTTLRRRDLRKKKEKKVGKKGKVFPSRDSEEGKKYSC